MQTEKEQLQKLINPSLLNYQIIPQSNLSEVQNMRYYEQYKKLHYTAFHIQQQLKQFKKIIIDLGNKIHDVDKNIQNYEKGEHNLNDIKNIDQKQKRYRRTNQMIQRNFVCQHTKCGKTYASEGSLQQHIRLKHEDSLQYHRPLQHKRVKCQQAQSFSLNKQSSQQKIINEQEISEDDDNKNRKISETLY